MNALNELGELISISTLVCAVLRVSVTFTT